MLYLPDLRMKPIPDTEPGVGVGVLLRTALAELAAGKVNLEVFAPEKRSAWMPERIEALANGSSRLAQFNP